MINTKGSTGKLVIYLDKGRNLAARGTIQGYNDQYVFVRFDGSCDGKVCVREDLYWFVDQCDIRPARPIILKDCPCCGSQAKFLECGPDNSIDYWIECTSCNVRTSIYNTQEDAATRWNTRYAI